MALLMRSARFHVNCPLGTTWLLFCNGSGRVANLEKTVAEML